MRRIPNFVLLRTFEAAARLESFSGAAAELNLTPSAVSHQIKELEAYLGRPLFERLHRRVTLTTDGRQFARNLSGTFDSIESAWQDLAAPSTRLDLIVHCAPSFATNWLGPRIKNLVAIYPQMRLTILSDAEPVDLIKRREVDVIISYCGYLQRDEISTFPVGVDEFAPMCAPEVRNRFSTDRDTVLNSVPIESRGSCISWSTWYGRTGIRQPISPALTFDRLSMKIAAAADGLGVVLESTSLAERELADGRLIKMNGIHEGVIIRESHFISVRKREMETWKINAFLQWLKSEWNLSTQRSNKQKS
ncbi:LysR family transcriptional regulator [Paraburkholderia phosphatilytica]|uniref:LysR family transcriptional regulator n=1 Tax=Paraburkholderia phosphatilytica TaxID=2282883 RepID=UPI000E4857F0|nr:LysR family transcriptional regulator [Paraburkholderia phosphatilytica]